MKEIAMLYTLSNAYYINSASKATKSLEIRPTYSNISHILQVLFRGFMRFLETRTHCNPPLELCVWSCGCVGGLCLLFAAKCVHLAVAAPFVAAVVVAVVVAVTFGVVNLSHVKV